MEIKEDKKRQLQKTHDRAIVTHGRAVIPEGTHGPCVQPCVFNSTHGRPCVLARPCVVAYCAFLISFSTSFKEFFELFERALLESNY